MTGSLLDSVLDRTVIGGYTNVGYRIRSRGWSASELRSLGGRVVMVTGATSGLGLAAAEGFARLGATVWLVVRSEDRGEQARAVIIEQSGSQDVHVGGADTIVWLGAAEEPGRSTGLFWHDRRPRPTHLLPWTRETQQERERLWAQCAQLSGWAQHTTTSEDKENPDGPLPSRS